MKIYKALKYMFMKKTETDAFCGFLCNRSNILKLMSGVPIVWLMPNPYVARWEEMLHQTYEMWDKGKKKKMKYLLPKIPFFVNIYSKLGWACYRRYKPFDQGFWYPVASYCCFSGVTISFNYYSKAIIISTPCNTYLFSCS